jgi:hypothetical protein
MLSLIRWRDFGVTSLIAREERGNGRPVLGCWAQIARLLRLRAVHGDQEYQAKKYLAKAE